MKTKKIYITMFVFLLIFFISGCSYSDFFIGQGDVEKVMYIGDKIQLYTNKVSSDTGETVLWESSDELVVTVDETGLVEAINKGVANVTATLDGTTRTVVIKVYDLQEIVEINIEGKQTVLVNKTITLTAKTSISEPVFIWSTSDATVATIDQTGTVYGLKPGVATIKVTLENNTEIYSEMVILVRTGDGIQDIITNYINQNIYITGNDYDITSLNDKVVNLVKNVEESVIGVSTYDNASGTSLSGTGTGGIFKKEITNNGFKYTVFTNHHVIEDGLVIKVYLGDLDEYVIANVITYNEEIDIAILTFEHTKEYEPLKIGKIGTLNNGDFVVAIGNPGGYTYYGSVTFGMISCYNRQKEGTNIIYVQHDAPINPGNSGGPLFNLKGEVIGINTLKIAASDVEGMGFAIALESMIEYLK